MDCTKLGLRNSTDMMVCFVSFRSPSLLACFVDNGWIQNLCCLSLRCVPGRVCVSVRWLSSRLVRAKVFLLRLASPLFFDRSLLYATLGLHVPFYDNCRDLCGAGGFAIVRSVHPSKIPMTNGGDFHWSNCVAMTVIMSVRRSSSVHFQGIWNVSHHRIIEGSERRLLLITKFLNARKELRFTLLFAHQAWCDFPLDVVHDKKETTWNRVSLRLTVSTVDWLIAVRKESVHKKVAS
jgi:hypothetical protein